MRPSTLGRLGTTATAALAVAFGLALTGPAGARDDQQSGASRSADAGVAAATPARTASAALDAPTLADPIAMPTSYPVHPELRIYPDNRPDQSDTGGLIGHDDLAPELTDLMNGATGNRISTQVVGQSTQGRDLYLVTVTAAESESETAQQTRWREQIAADPVAAAADEELVEGYKTPIWISNNIHGNEWEGTDAALTTITDLVTARWSTVSRLLRNNRLYFSLSLNPDGRTAGTRRTTVGLDANRDMVTDATPEAQSYVRTAQAIQPVYAADFHGYTGVLQVEPCGPPHGENYEYDLFIPHAYEMALAVEEDVVAAQIPGNTYYDRENDEAVEENTGHIAIPYRDTPSGWDDYPPIFTAQYAAFFGAATATVELPLYRPDSTSQSPANARVNVAVAEQTMTSMLDYFDDNADAMLANQIEMFRRGVAGEPKDSLTVDEVDDVPGPEQWREEWDVVDDQDPVEVPRAYVIPRGEDQRSASDASRLVQQLLFHDIEVGTLDADTTVGGTTYPAGSYVVDMHQPMRGLANSLLDLGTDISDKVPFMYDISAWSLSYLWGATVDKVGATTDAAIGAATPVTAPTANATMPDGSGFLTFELAGVGDFRALNALLDQGVPVAMLPDGSAVVGAESRDQVAEVSATHDIAVSRASAADVEALDDEATRTLRDLTVAYVGNQDDTLALTELGFDDLVATDEDEITEDPSVVTDADVLWLNGGLDLDPGSAAHDALQAWVDAGHPVLGQDAGAFEAAAGFGLVSGTPVEGNGDGNGIAAVDTAEGSALAPYAQSSTFIYPATWFADLGEGTTATQTYADEPFLAGHWRESEEGAGDGPASAAGQPAVVQGEAASGARSVVFGTWPLFRTHPKGGLSQVARALFWAAPESDEAVRGESTTKLVVRRDEGRRYVIRVRVSGPAGADRSGVVEVVHRKSDRTRRVEVDASGRGQTTLRFGKGRQTVRGLYLGNEALASSRAPKVVFRVP